MEFIRKQREEAVEAFTKCGKHLQKFGDELFWEAMSELGVVKPPCVEASNNHTISLGANNKTHYVPDAKYVKESYVRTRRGNEYGITRLAYHGHNKDRLIKPSKNKRGELIIHLCVPENNNKSVPLSYVMWLLTYGDWPKGTNFDSTPNDGSAIIHIDGNLLNNNPDNLKEYDPQEDSQWLYNQTVV
jgi:hypothetical protein